MTRRRFYAPPEAFTSAHSLILQADEARHLRDVLRLKPGDEVYVFDGQGKEFHCEIEESRKDWARLKVLAPIAPAKPESPLKLTLAVALLKSDKFDLVVQKATELGAVRILPVMTKLADIRLRDEADAAKRVTRWQRIALEAAKQSGRALLPEVTQPISFPALTHVVGDQTKVMFSERDGRSINDLKDSGTESPLAITAVVGSEGGWTEEELSLARTSNWVIVTLGGRILRAETAAITAMVLLQHVYGDLR